MSILETETQLDEDGHIIVDSLPEPFRTQLRKLGEERTIDWITDGAEFSMPLEQLFLLSHWCGFDIQTQH
ncbi:MAG: hypothetical protein RSD57_17335 [Comamonas sp.]